MSELRFNRELIENPDFDWVAFKVCPDCVETWQGVLRVDDPDVRGPVSERCPDCDWDAFVPEENP